MTAPRNVNRCTPCLEGAHWSCTGSAGNIGCGCIHAAPAPQHVIPNEADPTREERDLAERYVEQGIADDLGDPTRPSGYTLAVIRARRDAREEAIRPFRDLFAGGPDTPCRTTWREESGAVPELEVPATECVEVPLDEVRAAFVEAGEPE